MATIQILIPLALCVSAAMQDGVEVTSFEAPFGPRVNDIRALYAGPDETLWVGTNGGGVSRFDGSEWTHFDEEEIGMRGVSAIFPGAEQDLWFTGPGGVSRFDGSEWEHFGEDMGRAVRVVFSGFLDEDGSVWFATNAGAVRFDDDNWEWTTTENGLKHDVVHDVQRDRSGNLWFATRRGGLSQLSPDGFWEHFYPDDNVRAILEDAEDSLWFGTGGNGALRFDGEEWTRYHEGETVLPLFADKRGNVWFSRNAEGALRFRKGEWSEHAEHIPGGELQGGGEGSDGSLWFGARGGLVRLRKTK